MGERGSEKLNMSIIVFIIVLSILIVVHEFGHFIMAKRCGVKVEIFSLGFGPKIIGIKRGDTMYQISAVPLGGYIKMAGESPTDEKTGASWEFYSKSVWDRFKIIISGPALNYIFGFLIFCLVFMIGFPVSQNTNKVGSLISGFPAQKHGIKTGDAIIAVDGKKTETWEEMVELIHKKTEGSLTLKVKRDEEIFNLELEPKVEKKFVFGGGRRIAMIGIKPEYSIERYGFFKSIQLGAQKILTLTVLTFKAIGWMIQGKVSMREMTGPVGIFVMTGEMTRYGFTYLVNFIGVISASLAIFNVLPIPVLDGGHILFLAIEKIKGKPLSFKAQETASQVGLYLLLTLMAFIFYSDFLRYGVIDKVLHFFGK